MKSKNRLDNIFLIRHGNSIANEDITLYKHIPDHAISLSEKGKKQAVEAGKYFAAFLQQTPELVENNQMRLWNSPYLRTRQTRDGMRIRDIYLMVSGNCVIID